jgi:hypothetical protein
MVSSNVLQKLQHIRKKVTDLSLRKGLDRVITRTTSATQALDKQEAMILFYSTTDHSQVTNMEKNQLELIYKEIKMTPQANIYMRDVLSRLKKVTGKWKVDHRVTIKREKLLAATLQNGKTVNYGIKGFLFLNGSKQCMTLERPLVGKKRCITNGVYTLKLRSVFSSMSTDGIYPTSKRYTRIQVPDNQSERSGIQIHWGKDIGWSDGCTLIGDYSEDTWLRNKSEWVYKQLIKKMAGQNAYKPKNEAEWSLVPRVKLIVTYTGNPS